MTGFEVTGFCCFIHASGSFEAYCFLFLVLNLPKNTHVVNPFQKAVSIRIISVSQKCTSVHNHRAVTVNNLLTQFSSELS